MMWLTLEMRTSLRCTRCELRSPIPGLRQRTTCPSCAEPLDLIARHAAMTDTGVRARFGGYYDCAAESLLYGDGHKLQGAQEDSSVNLRRMPPACACGAALPFPEPGVTSLTCAACRDTVPVRWPDAATRLWEPRLWCVIGDAGEAVTPTAPPVMTGTVVHCGNCGGGLAPQGRRRALICEHCKASNFLSDALGLKLYPQPEAHRFYLVYQLDDEALERMYARLATREHYFFDAAEMLDIEQSLAEVRARATLIRRERVLASGGPIELETARELAAWTALPEAEAARIDARLDDAVRGELEKGPVAPGLLTVWARSSSPVRRASAARTLAPESPLLGELARDPSGEVRLAVAARHATPPELLGTLRKDPDPAVAAAVKTNPSYQPGFFERVFG